MTTLHGRGRLQGCLLACFAKGKTRLVNVPQARLKETDRIAVMAAELAKLGAGGTVFVYEYGMLVTCRRAALLSS